MSPRGVRDVRRRWASRALMLASGFAGLGYEIIWTEQCSLWLGHESAAVLAVVTAFFGGLAVGALALGARIERSARPVRWYAGCELVVAAWSLSLLFAWSPFSGWVLRATGVQPSPAWQWSVAFCGTFLLFLPATAAMGATLPAIERLIARARGEGGHARSIAALYASNTFGAVLGVLCVAFWLIPAVGLARATAVCIALNLLCGVIALAVFPGPAEAPAEPAPGPTPDGLPRVRGVLSRFAVTRALTLAVTGLLGVGYEIVVVRVLSQVTEDTVYTFAILLAVYLVGTAAGAAGYQRWLADANTDRNRSDRDRDRRQDGLGDRLLATLAAACLAGASSLWAAERVKAWALHAFGASTAASMGTAIAAEAVLALMAFALPTILMGAVFSHLAARARAAGVSFGRALGVNTLAAATAPVIFGVVVIPALGPKLALLLIVLGYLALTAPRAWSTRAVRVRAAGTLAAALAVASLVALVALLAPPLRFVDVPAGGHVVSYREGVMAAVSVVEDAGGIARLRINNRQQEGSSATLRVDARQAWLPLLLHPAPARALFLGLGTGVTAASAAEDPTLDVDAVELLPEVIAASTSFIGPRATSRLHVVAADARRYARASDRRYDVIVSDNFHPARSGSGALYTVEHFAAVRRRLAAGGVFCQWLPLHQLDLDTLRSIVRSFATVYPGGWAMLASNSLETPVVGLVARADHGRFDVAAVHDRLARLAPRVRDRVLGGLGLEDELAVLGSFVAGPAALARFAGDAAANTDDLPVVAYRAPRITYAPESRPRDRLIALLRALSIEPGELILPAADARVTASSSSSTSSTSSISSTSANWPRRLAACWAARDLFIESGRDVRPSPQARDMLAQVREPLLSVLRICPEFRPAYDPLLAMATALARSDATGARALLAELSRIQPARAEAPRLLASIGDGSSAVDTASR